MAKKRLDILVLDHGLAESRERAKALIMAGEIFVDNQKADKPGDLFSEDAALEHRGGGLKYASRGGLKLEKALAVFPIDLRSRVCMDMGLPTACSKMAEKRCIQWMWDMGSWPGPCATTAGW